MAEIPSGFFMGTTSLSLYLFTQDPSLAILAESAGVDSIILDWENHNKKSRQQNYSTEINCDTPEDVARISAEVRIPVTVRINSLGLQTKSEISEAIINGAQIIMLPMATDSQEVKKFINVQYII
jgi:2-keto-3-deoxy-L-rhamnonate aldolase RhmA